MSFQWWRNRGRINMRMVSTLGSKISAGCLWCKSTSGQAFMRYGTAFTMGLKKILLKFPKPLKILFFGSVITFFALRAILVFIFREEGFIIQGIVRLLHFIFGRAISFKTYFKDKTITKVSVSLLFIAIILVPYDLVSIEMFLVIALGSILAFYIGFKFTSWDILYFPNRWLINLIYRIHVEGEQNLPTKGPAVLICNHISFIDFAVVSSLSRTPLYFVMDYRIYNLPIVRWFCQFGKAIPIDSYKNPEIKEAAFDKIKNVLNRGDIVFLFPEGQVSYDGEMDFFRRGLLRIREENQVPIIPMTLTGLEGGYFSRVGDLFNPSKLPTEFFRKVTIKIGSPIPPGKLSIADIEHQVREMLHQVYQIHREGEEQRSNKQSSGY